MPHESGVLAGWRSGPSGERAPGRHGLARSGRVKYGLSMFRPWLSPAVVAGAALFVTGVASAQEAPLEPPPAPPANPWAPAGDPWAPSAAPPTAPAPAPAPPPPSSGPPPPAGVPGPAPAPAAPQAPPQAGYSAPSGYPAAPGYATAPPPGYGYSEPPPPPLQQPDDGPEIPDFSVRFDPLRWLIFGKVGIELEVELWKFISLELVPVFVVDTQPPAMNDFDGVLSQHSNGIGALAGTSIGVGFWLSGEPMRGQVLRAIFTNEAYSYRSEDDLGRIDAVDHTERHLYGFIGSYDRWGPFTIGGGFGIGVELNEQRRCFTEAEVGSATEDCRDEQLQIALDREVREVAGLNSSLHPIQLMGRISLGVVF